MLFNTFQFAVFFIIVYALYLWLNHKWQNRMLLVASYIFYGAWDWRFLSLLLLSTVIDYFCALKIYESSDPKRRKLFLSISIIASMSILGFFKYFNFFARSFETLLAHLGFSTHLHFLNIILPVGVSFYTFQTMSYVIDVYRRELDATRNFFDFALFVTYFPQLVAGPIERASHLLPQVLRERKIKLDEFYQGCYLIFWGLYMKVFIADNLAKIVEPIFAGSPPDNGLKVWIAVYAFTLQIFCDFAGYSEIARGLGKIMGFDIMVNFNLPYFAANPKEFWQRWHISLSTWLRDYLYKPLGGNRKGTLLTYRNLGATMLLGGLWHGAGWTYIIWGAYHGMLLVIHRAFEPLLKKVPQPKNLFIEKTWFGIRVIFFFHLICLGLLIFRAKSMAQVFSMLQSSIQNLHFTGIESMGFKMVFFLWLLIVVQLFQYKNNDLMIVFKSNILVRMLFYFICFYSLVMYGVQGGKEFVYFQF